MATWLSTDEPLFCLVSAGHKVYDRPLEEFHDCNRRLPPLRAVLQLTLSGAGFHRRGGRRSLITPGMAFLDILPGDWSYGGAVESRGAYEQVFLAFNGESAFSLTQQLTARFGHVLEFGRNSALVAPMMVLARQFERHQPVDRYQTSARIYEVCMLALSLLGRHTSNTCPITAGALQLIHKHAFDPAFNVAAMVDALGCSRSHLTRRFLAATASTPLEYLLQYRLEVARKAVRHGNEPIGEVARRCGFASSNYFCRIFRQRYHMTPKSYRLASGG